VLRGPATFSIDADSLTIARKGVDTLRFVPAPQGVAPPSLDVPTLTDTTWLAPDGKTMRIDAATGDVTGSYCTGRATTVGPAVRFTGCAPTGTKRYLMVVAGPTLVLTSGGHTLRFAWQPADATIDPAALANRTWTLESVAGKPASSGNLVISHGVAHISDECGTTDHPVRIERGLLSVHGSGPAKPCAASAAVDGILLSGSSVAWAVRGATLIIYGGGSQTFSLVYGTAKPQSSTLQGDWTITTIADSAGHARPATASAELRIAANGAVSGTDGCRSFTGTVQTNDASASFALTMQEPACAPRTERTAGFVDRLFGGPVNFAVRDDQLVLARNGVGQASFTARPVNGDDPQLLTAHDWQIDTITYGSGHFRNGAASQDNGFLTFTTHGFEVQHTCSTVDGTAQLAPGIITLSRQISGGHSCPPPVDQPYRDESAQAIDALLTGVVRWSVDGSVLTLTSGQGSLRAIGGIRSDLTSATWRLAGTAQGATETTAVGSVVLSFPNGTQIQLVRCYTSSGKLYLGDSSFSVSNFHTTVALPCPSGPPGTQQQNDFLSRLFSGEVTWAIVGDTLTLSRDGVGQAIFVRKH
jgi:heat shock protein HslJ